MRWPNEYLIRCWHSVKMVMWHPRAISILMNHVLDEPAIAIIGATRAGRPQWPYVDSVASVRGTRFAQYHNAYNFFSRSDRHSPDTTPRDTSDIIYMYTRLRFLIHTGLKWSTGLAQHDTKRGMDAEFRLSRERKRVDSASCLQLRGVCLGHDRSVPRLTVDWRTKESCVVVAVGMRGGGAAGGGRGAPAAERVSRASFPLLRNKRSINFLIRRA